MNHLIDAFAFLVMLGAGFWAGKLWNRHLVRAAEDKAEDVLAERNYWKQVAQDSIAENLKLGREIATVARFVRGADITPDSLAANESSDPPTVREADRIEMERRRRYRSDPITRKRGDVEAGVPIAVNDKSVAPSPRAIEENDD